MWEHSQPAAPLILPVQSGAGGAAGQSAAGPRAVPAVVPVQHSCLRCACVQHQRQVHPVPGRRQLQPHSGGADCHRQPATPGLPCLIPPASTTSTPLRHIKTGSNKSLLHIVLHRVTSQ